MIKKILKDVLGENFTENNEKYAKINFIIVVLPEPFSPTKE